MERTTLTWGTTISRTEPSDSLMGDDWMVDTSSTSSSADVKPLALLPSVIVRFLNHGTRAAAGISSPGIVAVGPGDASKGTRPRATVAV
jgi:hypothetical protein